MNTEIRMDDPTALAAPLEFLLESTTRCNLKEPFNPITQRHPGFDFGAKRQTFARGEAVTLGTWPSWGTKVPFYARNSR